MFTSIFGSGLENGEPAEASGKEHTIAPSGDEIFAFVKSRGFYEFPPDQEANVNLMCLMALEDVRELEEGINLYSLVGGSKVVVGPGWIMTADRFYAEGAPNH